MATYSIENDTPIEVPLLSSASIAYRPVWVMKLDEMGISSRVIARL
jgi:hypothetical protein